MLRFVTVGLIALAVVFTTGCGDSGGPAKPPEKMMELPKEGPKAAGAPGGKANAPGPHQNVQ